MSDTKDEPGCFGCIAPFIVVPAVFLALALSLPILQELLIYGPQDRARAWNDGWTAGRLGMDKEKNPFILEDKLSKRKRDEWNAGYDEGATK